MKKLEKKVNLLWDNIKIGLEKPHELIYINIDTNEYMLRIKANQERFWVDSYKKYSQNERSTRK